MVDLRAFTQKHARTTVEQGLMQALKDATLETARFGHDIYYQHRHGQGRYIWDDDWDVCLVLDSCRIDLFREVAPEYDWLPETIPSAWSAGGASPEWIAETFKPAFQDEHRQTAYVTANAFTGKEPDGNYRREDVYPLATKTDLAYLDEAWATHWDTSEKMESISPTRMTERGLYAYQNASVDRTVVHYMQPHIPFRTHLEWFDGWGGADKFGEPKKHPDKKDAWLKVRDDDIQLNSFWEGYKDNLRWGLEQVARWVEHTDATILITSDHGNETGEWGQWGHTPGSQVQTVREVPWVIVEGENDSGYQPNIDGDVPVQSQAESNVDGQLKALGYK